MRPALVLVLLVAGGAPYAAQQEPVPVYRAGVELVVFNVAVLDEEGAPVTGLQAGDFEVLEGGRRQQITLFATPGDSALDVALVLDASSSIAQSAPSVREDAMAFVDALDERDCVYFVPFRGRVGETVWAAPRDPQLAARIGGMSLEGGTALYDALVEGLRAVDRAPRAAPADETAGCAVAPPRADNRAVRRTAVVALSDGGDEHSLATFADALGVAVQHAVPIFAVAVGDAVAPVVGRFFRPGSRYARSMARRREVAETLAARLERLAHVTGGRLIAGEEDDSLADSFATVVAMLRSSYLVGYRPPPDEDRPPRNGLAYHPVTVRVTGRHVATYTRPGYYLHTIDNAGAELLVRNARVAHQRGDLERSGALLDTALALDPGYWPIFLQRARLHIDRGDRPAALSDLLRASELRPGLAGVDALLANTAFDAQDYELAWKHALRAQQGGAQVSSLLFALEEVSEGPEDLQTQLRAARVFVDVGRVPDSLDQGTLMELMRALRQAVADAPDLGLTAPWNVAEVGIILDVESVEGTPRRLRGEFVLTYAPYLSWEDENVTIDDLDDPASIAAGIARALVKVRGMIHELR